MILDIVGTALTSIITVVIAKTRCVTHMGCCAAAFNDPRIALDTTNRQTEDDTYEDNVKRLPLASYPDHTRPLPVHPDLRQVGVA